MPLARRARIKPAMTEEEWEQEASIRKYYEGAEEWYEYLRYMPEHKRAAVSLHGQPFGFTWADVERLRKLGQSRVCHGMGDYGPPDMCDPWIAALADRIAALLPPSGP